MFFNVGTGSAKQVYSERTQHNVCWASECRIRPQNSVQLDVQRRKAAENSRVSFQASPVSRYVKPVEVKHLGLLDKLSEFFAGAAEMLKQQQRPLSTKSGALNICNITEPLPEARIKFNETNSLTMRPKKFHLEGEKEPVKLCHFEYSSQKTDKFDVVLEDTKLVKKGDIFAFNFHRADKHPIRDNEAAQVNRFFDRYGEDILSIIKKYRKKLS